VSSGITIQDLTEIVFSNSHHHLRELSFLPYGHPNKGTHTSISQRSLRYYDHHFHSISHNYILTNNNYDAALNRTSDLIVGGI